MASQAIATVSQQSEFAATIRAGRRSLVLQSERDPIVLVQPKTVKHSHAAGRALLRVYAAVGASILCLFIGAIEDGWCDEGQQPAFVVGGIEGRIPQLYAIRERSDLVAQVAAEVTQSETKRKFEQTQKAIIHRLAQFAPGPQMDAGDAKAAGPSRSVPDREQQLALDRAQEWGRAEAFALTVLSKVRAQFDAARKGAEASPLTQPRAPTAETLTRELAILQSELDAARAISREAIQASEAGIEQTQALEQERQRADGLARELALVRTELEAARAQAVAVPETAPAAAAVAEQELKPHRDKTEALARDLAAAQAELEVARTAGSEAKQAIEDVSAQKQIVERELETQRNTTERLERELASARAEIDAARIAETGAKQAVADASAQKEFIERKLELQQDTAERLARDLASARAESDEARVAAWGAKQAIAEAVEQKHVIERELEQQRGTAERLVQDLAAVRAELETTRLADAEIAQAATAGAEQNQALERELKLQRDRADAVAGELTALRTELDEAREKLGRELAAARMQADERSTRLAAAYAEMQQLTETGRTSASEHKIALEAERDRADALTRELASVRDQLDSYARADVAKVPAVQIEQRQALEKELRQQRDEAGALAGELNRLRTELENAHGVARSVAQSLDAAKIEHEQALNAERDRAVTLDRELASVRMKADERSARLAAAYAEVLQITETSRISASEQKIALAAERDRADAFARELVSVRDQLDAGHRHLAALIAFPAPAAIDGLPEWVATSRSLIAEGRFQNPEQGSIERVGFDQELPPTSAERSTAHEGGPVLETNSAVASTPSVPARTSPRPVVNEQRLLARAIALLREADIGGARPVLEHAARRGSARAAFMLAETYDDRVLLSWRVRGITGDIAKAREFYELAQSAGIEDAKERIGRLQQLSVRSSPTQGR
ncbi:hypothetical protein [Bradyrhizobium sp. CB3481]|uniref:hypothetical protein n=1 Tax=Bradyrhizobium sp. CB3481 TaxID=3039158 RepID=UPI0024B1B5C5|nr:hypothetical protein [Bradyrhizobium sp. CB3481]WFU18475.1 hypothetical protein QA643_09060 [Bradyrhizobium sp. CB3481]